MERFEAVTAFLLLLCSILSSCIKTINSSFMFISAHLSIYAFDNRILETLLQNHVCNKIYLWKLLKVTHAGLVLIFKPLPIPDKVI